MKQVVVIGGGAAGLMAAVKAAQNGNRVVVVEKNAKPARKLLITGRGRCNVTNNCDIDTLIANTLKNGRFLYSAFSAFNSQDTMSFFENQGVELKTERGGRVFPVSDRAVDIVDALWGAAKKNGVRILQGRAVDIKLRDNAVSKVVLENGTITIN